MGRGPKKGEVQISIIRDADGNVVDTAVRSPNFTPDGKFAKGNNVAPPDARKGKKGVNGRRRMLSLLDSILCQPEIEDAIGGAFVRQMLSGDARAINFFRTVVMPLMPKEIVVDGTLSDEGKKKLAVAVTFPGELEADVTLATALDMVKETSDGKGTPAAETSADQAGTNGSDPGSDAGVDASE